MINKLEKLKNLKDKIQDRMDDLDYMLVRSTLDNDLINERIRLHQVLGTIDIDIRALEGEQRAKAVLKGLASHTLIEKEAEEESDEYSSWEPKE